MKKIVLFLALFAIWSTNVNAADRDCAKYTPAQASAATSNGQNNTFSATFSGITARQGTSNADCVTAEAETPANSSENAVTDPQETSDPSPYGQPGPGGYQMQQL